MKKETFDIQFSDLSLNFDKILDLLSTSGEDLREMMSDILQYSLSRIEKTAQIKAEYQIFEDFQFLEKEHCFLVDKKKFIVGKLFSASLKKVDKLAVFSCTLGNEADLLTQKEDDLMKAYVLDIASAEVIEATARFVENKILQKAEKENKSLTNRYAPGYCGWDLQEQHKLFELLGENFCQIKLTKDALMLPIKSLSGIFGIGKNVKHVKYACQLCNSQNCIYRGKR